MDHDNSIGAISSDIVDEVIAEFVRKAHTVEALGCIRIDEDETGIAVHIGRCRAFRIEIPTQDAAVTRDTLLKCLKGTNDYGGVLPPEPPPVMSVPLKVFQPKFTS